MDVTNTQSRRDNTNERTADAVHVPATSAMRLLPSGATTTLKNWGPRSENSAEVNAAAACAWAFGVCVFWYAVSSEPSGDDVFNPSSAPADPFTPCDSSDMSSPPPPSSNVWNTDCAPGVTRPTCACAAPTV